MMGRGMEVNLNNNNRVMELGTELSKDKYRNQYSRV
jgi:hypothetical protein